jgi:N,N'-diacetyllegionaminate synthase
MVKIVAEVCQNHKGEKGLLGEMIHAAAENGAYYIKMQSIFSEDLTPRGRFEYGEMEDNGVVKSIKRPYKPEYERLRKLDLSEEDHLFFIEECRKYDVLPITAIFSRKRIPFVASLPWPERTIKVPSYDCASFKLIEELCGNFDNLIVSTGATFDEEIEQAANLIKSKGRQFSFLHCVTSYPNSMDMCNLTRISWLAKFTAQVGWSDHSLTERDGIKAAKMAIAMGARLVERHFTILDKDETKDGPVSITPRLLKELSEFARLSKSEQIDIVKQEIPQWQTMLGLAQRELTHKEMLNRDYYRGRFASYVDGEWIYNWEDKSVF